MCFRWFLAYPNLFAFLSSSTPYTFFTIFYLQPFQIKQRNFAKRITGIQPAGPPLLRFNFLTRGEFRKLERLRYPAVTVAFQQWVLWHDFQLCFAQRFLL